MKSFAVCTVPSRQALESLVRELEAAGIGEVFVMVHPPAEGNVEPIPGLEQVSRPPEHERAKRIAKGAGAGAVAGGALSAAGLFVPFVWPILLVTAPVMTLAGAAAGALAESTAEAVNPVDELEVLEDFAIPEPELGSYQQALEKGSFFVAVSSGDDAVLDRATRIFGSMSADRIRIFARGKPS